MLLTTTDLALFTLKPRNKCQQSPDDISEPSSTSPRFIKCVLVSPFDNSAAECMDECIGFTSASVLASAWMLYDLGDPPFIHDGYTIGQFEVS
jgi:hypothetical protein